MSQYAEEELLAQTKQTPSKDLVAQIRETLELSVDEFNHRGDFVALDEIERRLATQESGADA